MRSLTLDEAALMIIGGRPNIFSSELFDELEQGDWTEREISECLSRLMKEGRIDRTIEVRPRIVTRWYLKEDVPEM